MPGKYVIHHGEQGWYFTLETDDGAAVVSSDVFENEAATRAGIERLQEVAATTRIVYGHAGNG